MLSSVKVKSLIKILLQCVKFVSYKNCIFEQVQIVKGKLENINCLERED